MADITINTRTAVVAIVAAILVTREARDGLVGEVLRVKKHEIAGAALDLVEAVEALTVSASRRPRDAGERPRES